MKQKPGGSSFESLFPQFVKTEQYKVHAFEKQLKEQSDSLNKMIETAGKTQLNDKLKKLMEYQIKNLSDPKVSKQLDTMIEEYTKQSKMGKRQEALLKKQQKQIKDARTSAQKVAFDKSVAQGFSTEGLGSAVKGRGIIGGASAGLKYAGKSAVSSAKQMGFSGLAKGAMHFAGAALDTPALNIIASSINSNSKQNESMMALLKEFEDENGSSSEKKSGKITGSNGGTLSSDDSLETLHSIDAKMGELLFIYKDSVNDVKSSSKGGSIGSSGALLADAKSSDLIGGGIKDAIAGALGGGAVAGGASSGALAVALAPFAAFAAAVGSLAYLMNDVISSKRTTGGNDPFVPEGMDITRGKKPKIGFGGFTSDVDISPEDKASIGKMVMNSESKGDYGSASVLKDGAGLTAGAYQFTEKSGSLAKMIGNYNKANAEAGDTSRLLDNDLSSAVANKSMTPEQQKRMAEYIRKQQQENPERFKAAQDKTFNDEYLDPAIQMASKAGITDKSAIAMFADHYVNGGAGGANNVLKNMRASGVDMSKATAADVAAARKTTYSNLVASKPDKGQFAKGWNNRVDENLTALSSTSVPQTLPDVPASQPIDEDELARKIGIEFAKVMENQKPQTPAVVQTAGAPMKKYSLEDETDKSSWLALTGND